MAITMHRPARRQRRHGAPLECADRRALERAGWRTTLEFCENHVRGRDGRLLTVESRWTAEAERIHGEVTVASASAATADAAWAKLRHTIESFELRVAHADELPAW